MVCEREMGEFEGRTPNSEVQEFGVRPSNSPFPPRPELKNNGECNIGWDPRSR